jgi:ribosome assembly protein 4
MQKMYLPLITLVNLQGKLLHVLSAHAHWVNTMSLSTDFVLRTGAFDHTGKVPSTFQERKRNALDRYRKARRSAGGDSERLVSGSDDATLYFWEPGKSTKPVAQLTGIQHLVKTNEGHQKVVNHVAFSPNGRFIASASFDNSLKLWDGRDGK